ncbi:MAG: hypothetical protein ACM3NQ_10120 [Bacteroidales bacterium]
MLKALALSAALVVAPADTTPPADVIIRAADVSQSSLNGAWTLESDRSCPGGLKLSATAGEAGAADAPLAAPASYFDASFHAAAGVPYRLWLRLADSSDPSAGTSVWVQFSDADVGRAPAYAIGSTDGLLVSLDTCAGCRGQGWSWRGSSQQLAQHPVVTFRSRGWHRVRVQVRDGAVQLDHIVLSPSTYLKGPPDALGADRTPIARERGREDPWPKW